MREELERDRKDYKQTRYEIGEIYRRMKNLYALIQDQEIEGLETPANIEKVISNLFVSELVADYKNRRGIFYNDEQFFAKTEAVFGRDHFNKVIKPILEKRIFNKQERDEPIAYKVIPASSFIQIPIDPREIPREPLRLEENMRENEKL